MIYNSFSRKECIIVIMSKIESCVFLNANFFYVTNNTWKHAYRATSSPNNLIFVTEGTLYIEVLNERYEVNKNEFLYLPLGFESIGFRPINTDTGFYCVMFTGEESRLPTHFSVSDTSTIRDLYSTLIQKNALADYPKQGINRIMHCLFYEIQYQASHTAVYPQKSLSDNIKKYIISTVFRNITVHDIAVHFGLSDDYVTQLFYKYEHITPKAYINQLKIKKIEEYLISTNTSLQVIAKKLSFPNVSALSKFYKYHTGRTITQYRTKFIN